MINLLIHKNNEKNKNLQKEYLHWSVSRRQCCQNSMLFKLMFGSNGFPGKKLNGLFFIRVLKKNYKIPMEPQRIPYGQRSPEKKQS